MLCLFSAVPSRMPCGFACFVGQAKPARQGQVNCSGARKTGEMAHDGFLLNDNLARPGEQADHLVTVFCAVPLANLFSGFRTVRDKGRYCERSGNTNSFFGSCQKVSGGRDESKKLLI